METNACEASQNYLSSDLLIEKNERKTLWVVLLTSTMMVVEIVAGYATSSMALLADGWHMASHAGALAIAFFAYRLARSPRMNRRFSFGAGKVIPLGGYTSAIILALIAIVMGFESAKRFFSPLSIQFREATIVAVIGLLVNIVSALILKQEQHHHHHHHHDDHHDDHSDHVHDHNLKSAYIHVIADALTSVLAIVALVVGSIYDAMWPDALMGLLGSLLILRWAYHLCRDTASELLDAHSKLVDTNKMKTIIRPYAKIVDLHVWRVAPSAVACELVVASREARGSQFYRNLLADKLKIDHLVVEEQVV